MRIGSAQTGKERKASKMPDREKAIECADKCTSPAHEAEDWVAEYERIRYLLLNQERQKYDTAIFGQETFEYLIEHGELREADGRYYFLGYLNVMIHPTLGFGRVILTRFEYASLYYPADKEPEAEPDKGKPNPKAYHCPVCGHRYYDRKEAKECRRSHEWQNRRGRR